MVWRRAAALCLTLAAAPAGAQAVQPWPSLNLSIGLGGGLLAAGELVGRIAPDDQPSQVEARALIGHKLSHDLTGWIGAAHVTTWPPGQPARRETNLVEQLNWSPGALGSIRFSARGRLEQRFLLGAPAIDWRARAQLRLALPLGRPSAVLWAEPFLALNRTARQPRTLDQLRLFAGLSTPLGRRAALEVGYLYQRANRPGHNPITHAFPVVLSLHL